MANIEELIIGNLLEYQGKLTCVVELEENRLKVQYCIDGNYMTYASLKADDAGLKQINMSKAIIESMGLTKMEEGYCLSKVNATRMLCEGNERYYIGLSNIEQGQSPIHVTANHNSRRAGKDCQIRSYVGKVMTLGV